tara:strand:+ start:93 stop:488 length:396 start_codon:yes stop_codon:yes gene_type:complete
MGGVALGLLISTVTSLNVTISIVLQLGESIASVATTLADTDIGAITESAGGFALPSMTDSGAIDQNIMMFKLIASLLILIQVFTVSLISTRLRGGGLTSALGQTIKLTWIAAITSLLTSYVLDSSSGLFGT